MGKSNARKRSAAITLVLAGAAGLSGCGDPEAQRDVYRSLEDCRRDWNAPQQCEPVKDQRYSNSFFYGPYYYGSSFPSGRPRPSPSALEAHYPGLPPDKQERSYFSPSRWSSSFSSGTRMSTSHGSSSHSGTSRGGFGSSAHSSGG